MRKGEHNTVFCKLLLLSCLCFSLPVMAQEMEDHTFGGWEFFEVNYDFRKSPFFASFYFEHDNYRYQRFACWYTRTTLGVKALSWLKADIAYDFLMETGGRLTHKALFDLTGTLKQGGLKVSIRERYVHSWTPSAGKRGSVLRSRLKVQYDIPESRFSPYLAIETFTWDTWQKTRHYVACNYNINKTFQLETYYLYYSIKNAPAEHIIGLGLNIYL